MGKWYYEICIILNVILELHIYKRVPLFLRDAHCLFRGRMLPCMSTTYFQIIQDKQLSNIPKYGTVSAGGDIGD